MTIERIVFTPKALHRTAQRCCAAATLGNGLSKHALPRRGYIDRRDISRCNPFGVSRISWPSPQGSRSRGNPGLRDRNPFGVRTLRRTRIGDRRIKSTRKCCEVGRLAWSVPAPPRPSLVMPRAAIGAEPSGARGRRSNPAQYPTRPGRVKQPMRPGIRSAGRRCWFRAPEKVRPRSRALPLPRRLQGQRDFTGGFVGHGQGLGVEATD
jgi:hypothetical protein